MGKPEKGTVQLKAYNEGNHIVVEITDDGKGLDPNGLKAKAIEKNLITEREADQMTDKEAFALIFKPGFSMLVLTTSIPTPRPETFVTLAAVEKPTLKNLME